MTTTGKKVSERMTKKELVEVIKTQQQELEAKKARDGVDRKSELKLVQEKETVKSASETSVEDIIKTFRVEINGALSGFEEQLLAKKEKLDEIQDAIMIEEQKLQDVYQISHQSDTLEALLRAHEKEKEEHNALVKAMKDERAKEQDAQANFIREREALTQKEWDRKLEEHNYEWKQKIAREKDQFAEEKKLKQRELKELEDITNDALAKREAAIVAQEEELNRLKTLEENFGAEKQTAIDEAVAKALKSEKTSRHFEVSTLKKDHEAEKSVLENNNANLTTRVAELAAQNTDLRAKLEAAYTEMRGLAKDTIEASSKRQVYVTNEAQKTPSSKEHL